VQIVTLQATTWPAEQNCGAVIHPIFFFYFYFLSIIGAIS
jgi:hypothetical protein